MTLKSLQKIQNKMSQKLVKNMRSLREIISLAS